MGVTVAVMRQAVNTSTGTQNFTTTDLGGLTPKAAFFIATYATTDGVAADHAMFAVGAVTGASNRWSASHSDENLAASSDSYAAGVATQAIRITSPLDGTVDGEADFSAWVTNGITINWTNAPSAAFLLTVFFVAGTDALVHANSVALGNTVDVAVDVTAPGFRPDLVLACLPGVAGAFSLGFIHENGAGTVTQRCNAIYARDNQTTMVNQSSFRSDAGIAELGAGGATVWYGEFGAFDSSGFSVTPRVAGAQSRTLYYLALSFGGVADAWVGTVTTPTSTGSNAVTAPNFQPQFVMLIPSLSETAATVHTDSRAYSWGMSVIDADEQYSNIVTSQDAATDGNTQSLSDNVAVSVPDHTGALDIEATLTSLDATGWTLNYSNVTAVAKLWPALAIEAVASGTNTPQTVAGTLTSSGAISKGTAKTFAGTITSAGAMIKAVAKTAAGTLTTSGALLKATTKTFAGTLTSSGALATARGYVRSFEGTLSSAGALVRSTGKTAAGTLTTAGALAKQTGKALAGTLASSGALTTARIYVRTLVGTLTSAGALSRATAKSFAGSLTPAGALLRNTAKSFVGTLTPAGSIVKATAKVLSGVLASAGALAAELNAGAQEFFQSAGGTLTTAGTIAKATSKALAGVLASSGAITTLKAVGQAVGGALAMAGAVAKATTKSFAGTLTGAGSVSKVITKTLAGTLTTSGALLRAIAKSLAGTLTSSGVLATARGYIRDLAGTLAPTGAISRSTGKVLAGTLTPSGTISRAISKVVAGTLSFLGTLLAALVGDITVLLDVELSDSAVYTVALSNSAVHTVTLSDSAAVTVSLSDTTRS